MYAVIRTGGKQYKVAPQDVLQIEKIEGAPGAAITFSDVLLVAGEGEPKVGAPLVEGAVVLGEVVEQGRGPKIIIFKKKRRQNYRRKNGHRQDLTTVKILSIATDGQAEVRQKAEVKEETQPKEADEAEAAPAPDKQAEALAPEKVKKAAKPKDEAKVQTEEAPQSSGAPKKAAKKAPKTE